MSSSKAEKEPIRGPKVEANNPRRFYQDFKVGIALQLRLQSKESSDTVEAADFSEFRHALATEYAVYVEEHGDTMPAMYTPEHLTIFEKNPDEMEAWIIGGAPNLSAEENDKSYWSVQLESPMFNVDERRRWTGKIEFLYEFLNKSCIVKTDRDCHVMVRTCAPEGFKFEELQNIARSIFWFEAAFTPKVDLLNEGPNYRDCMDPFAKRNRKENREILNGNVPSEDEIWRTLQGCKSRAAVVELMCPGRDNRYRWDLTAADMDREAMIEFRGGNGGAHPGIALLWMEISVNFVIRAMKKGTHEGLARYSRDEGGCQGWVMGKHTIG